MSRFTRIGTAVVGVGLLGERHAEHYQQHPSTGLVLVHDRNPERARLVGERLHVPWTTSLADVAASGAEGQKIELGPANGLRGS
jgi:predicted dehydrogenase